MPFGNGTGPMGTGPMTGRGLGRCAGYSSPGYVKQGFGRRNFGWGRGFGYDRGYGRGMGRYDWGRAGYGYYPQTEPQMTEKEEKEILNEELNYLKDSMKTIEKRIQELETKKKK